MTAGSLRLRLMVGGMLAVLMALVVAWLAMTWLFERHVERREADELTRVASVLVAGLHLASDGSPTLDQQPADPRLMSPAGGLYWQVSTAAGTRRSRSLWDQALRPPGRLDAAAWRSQIVAGPFEDRVLIVERVVRPDRDGPQVLIQVASEEKVLRAARREFGRDLALFLAGLWLVLSAAAAVQITLGLAPLRRVWTELGQLKRSPSARLSPDHPMEVAPLIAAINDLAQAREADLARARRRAGDLAHSLKTPLSALSVQSRRAREAGATDAADGLDRAIEAIGAALEAELARSRAAALREAAFVAEAAPLAVVERLISVIERTGEGERLVFEVIVDPALRAPVPEDALTEMLGALIENAARHGRRRVRVSGVAANGVVRLAVEDDGAGLEDERAEAALMRGGRLDEAGPGHGLGLAIVRDLTQATSGNLTLERSDLGGLRVALTWPTADT